MPFPAFSIDGVLPPYCGANGPGGAAEDMSPYAVTAMEVVSRLAFSEGRKTILRGWLRHRADLRAAGFQRGFQWLDGSFVEDKEPKDLDVVSFLFRPHGIQTPDQLIVLIKNNIVLFDRPSAKAKFNLDVFSIDLNGSPEALINATRYYLGLFSHRRGDDLWKGMLQGQA